MDIHGNILGKDSHEEKNPVEFPAINLLVFGAF